MRVAAIDIGTVTCRLLIAEVDGAGELRELLRRCEICNLGEGVDETKLLKPRAIERVAAVVKDYLSLAQANDAKVVAMATSASRDAENSSDFQERLRGLGLELSVIEGEVEAALSFLGAASDYPGQPVVVIDIGGGSTEIIAGVAGAATGPKFAHSFNVGCRRLTERFLKSDPPTAEEVSMAAQWVREEFCAYVLQLVEHGCFVGPTVAVAGTATSAISMREAMEVYDPAKVHGSRLTFEEVCQLLAKLSALPLAQRQEVVGLEPKRASVIVAGFIILKEFMELAAIKEVVVSEHDILQGIIMDFASAN